MLKFCTISKQEQRKCEDWSQEVNKIPYFEFDLECVLADGKDQCMRLIEDQKADMVLLDPGEVYISGRYHSLVPILYEQYSPNNQTGYFAVAVVKSNSQSYIQNLKDLRGKKACFSGVGQLAGWVLPINKLIELDLIDIIDCNNVIQNAANFFGPSCAPNSLIDKFNPIGSNPRSMCSLCSSDKCSGGDMFANFEGALQCLLNGGEVAFVKHTSVDQLVRTNRYRRQDFELLCPSGVRTSVDNYLQCNWGYVPSHAVSISSVVLPEKRQKIQNFLLKSVAHFASPSPVNRNALPVTSNFHIFDSMKYGGLNLVFSDDALSLAPVDQYRQSFRGYFSLFNPHVDVGKLFKDMRKCFVPSVKLCVVSERELNKCNNMKQAFRTNMLQPELSCVLGDSTVDCMRRIQQGQADVSVLDAADIYTGGQQFGLEPILAEQNNLNDSYFAVAIAKKSDQNTDLLYLKKKRSCHSGYRTAAGWVIPMAFLLSNSRMRSYGCDSVRAASEFFSKSCAPGALSKIYHRDPSSWEYKNLCDLCHGNSYRFCRRDSSEPYFGDTGALQCLVEGGGDVAFAKHTTIFENTNGINNDFWARNKILDDFELLCRDGSRSEVKDYMKCNLGRISSNALVTNSFKPYLHKEAYVTLFIYAQQFYGSKYSDEFTFKMFVSDPKYKDLIFQDSTVKLASISSERRDYRKYLGHEFLKAMTIVDCTATANSVQLNSFLLCSITVLLFIRNYF